jgi:nitrogen regulatory protein PII
MIRKEHPMKMIMAIVQPARFEAIKYLLGRQGFRGLTVSEVLGIGRQRGRTEIYRGREYAVNLIPKVKLEIALDDDDLEGVVDAIMVGGRSTEEGRIGDGKIFVMPLEEVVRIRTGHLGVEAL